MESFDQIKAKRISQLEQWVKENTIGFMLWQCIHAYPTGLKDIVLTLQQWQCKDGIYIIQINQEDNSFLIFKTQADICLR